MQPVPALDTTLPPAARSYLDYDPFSEQVLADPYPHYARLRRDSPVHFAPMSRMYCVSRYEDVVGVLRTPEDFSSDATRTVINGAGPAVDLPSKLRLGAQLLRVFIHSPRIVKVIAGRNLLSLDAPAHTHMRNIVNRAFTPRGIAAWEPRIRAITEHLATELRRKRSFDFVADFAVPLPVTVIVELLGVEPERSEEFKRWSDALIAAIFGPKRK